MKERPILFNAPMVRAIIEGRKTQTRRVVKHQPIRCTELPFLLFPQSKNEAMEQTGYIWPNSKEQILALCPYGRPGDRLWVRETWSPRISHSCGMDACDCSNVWIDYPAGGEGCFFDDAKIPDAWVFPKNFKTGKSIPSIHMPRWASRILLEIVSVRVERLQDISDGDAKAECPPNNFKSWRDKFCALWQQINGDGSWDANPWVWVVEFKKVEQ